MRHWSELAGYIAGNRGRWMTSSRSEQRTPHTKTMYTRSKEQYNTKRPGQEKQETRWTMPKRRT